MTVALVVVGVAAYLTVYFAVGWALAKRDLPNLWGRARKEWSGEDYRRNMVKSGTILTLFFWPFRLPFIKALNIVDTLDPQAIEARQREQEQRIADLERELRIGRRS